VGPSPTDRIPYPGVTAVSDLGTAAQHAAVTTDEAIQQDAARRRFKSFGKTTFLLKTKCFHLKNLTKTAFWRKK